VKVGTSEMFSNVMYGNGANYSTGLVSAIGYLWLYMGILVLISALIYTTYI